MPDFLCRKPLSRLISQGLTATALCTVLLAAPSHAQEAPASAAAGDTEEAKPAPMVNSALDAPLFYQLLIGEMELQNGEPGNAFQVLLDAARRTGDEALFQRVLGIALQARAGEQALQAARAWRQQLPDSLEAVQSLLQVLLALNRTADMAEPLSAMLRLTPSEQRAGAIAGLPRVLRRLPEPQRVLDVVAPVLKPYLQQPSTAVAAQVTLARMSVSANNNLSALTWLNSAATLEPKAEGPALLALDMMSTTKEAEPIVQAHLQAQPNNHAVRLAYGRTLARLQRLADATRELTQVTQADPKSLGAWLTLGALELEMQHPEQAEAALKAYLAQADIIRKEEPEHPETGPEALQQVHLLLAQAAEQKGDLKGAEAWLNLIGNAQELTQVQFRRASLLARQGKLAAARKLIQALPEKSDEDIKTKLLAETQLLRDARQWQGAHEVLTTATKRFPNDANLLYELAMMSEKLDRMTEMEAQLRRVMVLRPDHHHAYNALGYSLAERNIRLPEAKALIEKALELAPSEPFLLDSLGWVEFRLGRLDVAQRWLQQAYQSRPDTEIAAHLGEVLWVQGKQEEAKRIWREGARRDRNNAVLRETLARLRVSL